MKRGLLGIVASALVAVAMAAPAALARQLTGEYMEVRSADVYTGPCFANSQADLVGKEAIIAWKVNHGVYHGVRLDGLGVVAVVKARTTLGDTLHDPYPAESVLIVDARATPAQREALESLAREQAGRLLDHITRVDFAPIHLVVNRGMMGGASLVAGKLASIKTRPLCSGDKICGNEVTFYPPLVPEVHARAEYTLEEAFQGKGLGVKWQRWDRRSAFVGSFSL